MDTKKVFIHNTSIVLDSCCEDNVKIYQNCNVQRCRLGIHTSIGDFSRIDDSSFSEHVAIQRNAMIYSSCIGRYTYTGRNFTAWHCTVGAFCSVSWNVSIGGANHDYTKKTTHAFLSSPDFGMLPEGHAPGPNRFEAKCVIGNDVWITANACICRGVTVGDGAVIAAGAVVTKDVAPYTIVAGVPAKPIKKRFSEDIIAVLQKSKWWDYPEQVIKEHFDLFNCTPDMCTAQKILQLREKFDPEMIK